MEDALRPRTWDEYIGQVRVKDELDVHVEAALHDDTPLDHVLICAPSGAGKTALAEIIAARLDEPLEHVHMPIDTRTLARYVRHFRGILFLDEVHRAAPRQQEELLPLLEFGWVMDPRDKKVEAEWLTIIAATTEPQKLVKPLVQRFPIHPSFDPYTDDEMAQIALSMASRIGVHDLDEETAMQFGRAAAGTPRHVREFVLNHRKLTFRLKRCPTADEVLVFCRTDGDGLTEAHLRYMRTLEDIGTDRPIGLKPLARILQLSESMVEELENLLLARGFLTYGANGRELTRKGSDRIRPSDLNEVVSPAGRRRPRRGAA